MTLTGLLNVLGWSVLGLWLGYRLMDVVEHSIWPWGR